MWLSVPALTLGSMGGLGPWDTAMDLAKAAAHLGALVALWVWPRRIALIIHTAFAIDLAADFTSSVLLGGFYDSGLQMMWSLISVLAVLVLFTVRAAVVWSGLFAVALMALPAVSSQIEPLYDLADPQADGVFTIIGTTIFVFLGLFYFVRQRDHFQRQSDDLLHNILPDAIATRLKAGDRIIADHFDDVSVLFLDVVGFTPLSTEMTPTELVGMLNEIFTDIDRFVGETGLEKIKTVGDEYMVAAGVPTPRPDHAQAIADLALRIQAHLATHTYRGHRISVRIGINSGPVVAGIIGQRKFSYDLWGDVVNTASRMETHGDPGTIQITTATRNHLDGDYRCERRGIVTVKGKGDLETWFLKARL